MGISTRSWHCSLKGHKNSCTFPVIMHIVAGILVVVLAGKLWAIEEQSLTVDHGKGNMITEKVITDTERNEKTITVPDHTDPMTGDKLSGITVLIDFDNGFVIEK